MLARLQQLTTLALLALAVTCAVLLAIGGLVLWAVAVFVLFAAGHAIVLGLEFLWLAGANRAVSQAPATLMTTRYEVASSASLSSIGCSIGGKTPVSLSGAAMG